MTDSNKKWYGEEAGFFDGRYLSNFGAIESEQTKREVDFIQRELRPKPSARILDLACGHGRHSIELAQRGFEVTGQDLSSAFIAEAERLTREKDLSVKWVRADMREVSFKDEFDFALILFSSFGYLETDEEDQKVLDAVSRGLKSSGQFLLDVRNRERIISNYRPSTSDKFPDGTVVDSKLSFDLLKGRNIEQYTRISPDGITTETTASIRLYTVTELVEMLRKAHLTVESVFGDFDSSSLSFNSKRCILVARKMA